MGAKSTPPIGFLRKATGGVVDEAKLDSLLVLEDQTLRIHN